MYLDYMTHLIVIKRSTPSKDKYGGETDAVSEIGTYLARPDNLSGTEVTYNAQNQAQVFDKIYTTYDCDVQELDTIELRDKHTNALLDTFEARRVAPQKQTQALHHIEIDAQVYR